MSLDETFTALARDSGRTLVRLAYQLTHDQASAEDVVQEALTRMYRSWRRSTPEVDHLEAYARRAVVNEYLRRHRRRESSEIITDDVPDRIQPDEQAGFGDRDEVWAALATLSARQRAVLVLRYYEDLPDDRIADAIGVRPATVRSLAARALMALRTRQHESGELL